MDNNFNEDFIIRSGVVGKSERNGQIYDFFRNRLMFLWRSVPKIGLKIS